MESLGEWFFSLSENYSVNPWIFGILYIGGIPVFLGVAAWMAKRARQKKPVLLQAGLLIFLAILPYLYVAIFGENLPVWVYAAIAAMIGFGVWSTVKKVRKQKAEAQSPSSDMPSQTLATDAAT
ncbi:hypothetical protein [Parvularcula maris]|uniref:Uncharacterized protein n=1 Tax=Parvularcula maris TaxID=2965077 RepID=A0A9X2L7D5_9PROT|nr:hypothetical protein [Parvularcula maris]MCQ8184430.1 hypothetical protein [Parvularcula maris]